MTLQPTPECVGSQTVGPYYAIGLDHLVSETLAGPGAIGRHITLSGTVFDADGQPVPDAIVELWQASAEGLYREAQELGDARSHEGFLGFARLSTHDNGRFHVHTVEPGPVAGHNGDLQAPHIVVLIFMRGLMRHLVTRIYLPNQALNAGDAVLQLVPEDRRHTLIAQVRPEFAAALQWDIHMQGPMETVFFEC